MNSLCRLDQLDGRPIGTARLAVVRRGDVAAETLEEAERRPMVAGWAKALVDLLSHIGKNFGWALLIDHASNASEELIPTRANQRRTQ